MIVLALNAALINTADKIPSTPSLRERHAVIEFLNLGVLKQLICPILLHPPGLAAS
jgi:hypothetical protein